MIPTTLTSSSSSTSSPATTTAAGGSLKNLSAAFTGIAALILEGRAIAEDEFQRSAPLPAPHISTTVRHSAVVVNPGNCKDFDVTPFHPNSPGAGAGGGGRQSPKPSTSRAAAQPTNSPTTTRVVVNITTNPQAFGFRPQSTACDDSTFAEATTHRRWTQKLCQLRQASPAATANCGHYDQQVAVEVGDAELVALQINTETTDTASDFEVVRRAMLNRCPMPTAGGSAAASSSSASAVSTEKFLHSLQSLATTCLRAGSPSLEPGLRYQSPNTTTLSHSSACTYTAYHATPPRTSNPFAHGVPGSASSCGSGLQSPQATSKWSPAGKPLCGAADGSSGDHRTEQFLKKSTNRIAIPSNGRNSAAAAASHAARNPATTCSYPQQGPHCEQFLRKMGLWRSAEAADAEDHVCDMSHVNIMCSRWRAYCLKLEAIVQRGEPVCIEVYLGPVRHKILLEQWIISQKDKVPPPTMTLPSLCSAIRSQLYFSQISAWCDLIKKSDETIYETERVIFPTATGAAGDLATASAAMSTSGTSPNASCNSSPSPTLQPPTRPRLNIFYRIKRYDSTACFNSAPNVHNFPSVAIADGCNVSVCLKSLPRINGGIPKVGAAQTNGVPAVAAVLKTAATTSAFAGAASTTSTFTSTAAASARKAPQTSDGVASTSKSSRAALALAEQATTSAASAASNCDNNKKLKAFAVDCAVSSAHRRKADKCMSYTDEEELPSDAHINEDDGDDDCTNGSTSLGDDSNSSFCCLLTHREKQLLKYRKRMLKRDKKTSRKALTLEAIDDALKAANGSRAQPMDQGWEEDDCQQQRQERPPQKQLQRKAMISTGTQTQANCCQCGCEKALVCLNCDNSTIAGAAAATRKAPLLDEMDSMDSCSISSSEIIHTPRNNAELLLQAIQRTPKAAKKNKMKQALRRSPPSAAASKISSHMDCDGSASAGGVGVDGLASGCQVCKRQKTQHNFSAGSSSSGSGTIGDCEGIACDEDVDDGDGKSISAVVSNTSSSSRSSDTPTKEHQHDAGIVLEECFSSSTKLTPHLDRCSLYHSRSDSVSAISPLMRIDDDENTANASRCHSCTPSSGDSLSEDAALLVSCERSFHSPTNAQLQPEQHKHMPKPTLLHFAANCYRSGAGDGHASATSTPLATPPHNTLLLRKGLPKVNLTPIFCGPLAGPTDSPLATCFSNIPTITTPAASFGADHVANGAATAVDSNNIPVQKSYSAPTLPNTPSPSLSPRFAKQAAFYKRRSRHLSDRSDRSSLGSDEQISDEELECGVGGLYSPATSPLKMRARPAVHFQRCGLLGNLEESLLQRRLMPKIEVFGFKVLLGASGGFCPTQLTIPAASYFYELHGAAFSTPYVCEIRLPRKGYSIPRAGTVQATLLNPMGTVVRMFVIAYDMRDMPPLHQTFIRQRVLAEGSADETILTDEKGSFARREIYSSSSSTNNNSIGYQNGMNGDGDASTNDVNNTTIYAQSDNNDSNANNINSGKKKSSLSPNDGPHADNSLGHFISAENMKRLRYSIHLRFQTSRSGRLSLHTDIRLLISRRTDCDTAAAHAKGVLEAHNDLVIDTVMPSDPKYSARQESPSKI